MGGLALLTRALGHRVTGSDVKAYPPMSELLREQKIDVIEGYDVSQLRPAPDQVVVGNVLTRGNPAIEYLLEGSIPFTSGPAFLFDQILRERHVLAVSGTHGKTTTSSMLAWILEKGGADPGYLIGGVPENFGVSARFGKGPESPFVIEADEYDSAFFDKRSKFIHYRPKTLIINNVEFDHADIFDDQKEINRQFHHLVRTLPASARILRPHRDQNVDAILAMGCWSTVQRFGLDGGDWRGRLRGNDGGAFEVRRGERKLGVVEWPLIGRHNVANAVAAIAAAEHLGVPPGTGCDALCSFRNVKRRLEVRGRIRDITVYDDFAHHPTAIRATLEALRSRVGNARIIAVLDPASNSMRLGVYRDTLGPALAGADKVWLYRPDDVRWNIDAAINGLDARVCSDIGDIVREVSVAAAPGDHVLIMSNSGFGGFHARLLEALEPAPGGN